MIIDLYLTKLVIDELPEKPKRGWIYFLSRPTCVIREKDLEATPWLCFYTTPMIREIMKSKKDTVHRKHFETLQVENVFEIGDKGEINLTVITTGSVSGNVMFLFQYAGQKILYTGDFTEYRSVLLNEHIRKCILDESIDDLYIDNTFAAAATSNCPDVACEYILKIMGDYPDHKICLLLDSIGQEDFLLNLAKKSKIAIKINPLREMLFKNYDCGQYFTNMESRIEVRVSQRNVAFSLSDLRSWFDKDKFIVCKFASFGNGSHEHIYKKASILYISYESHPSPFDLYTVISYIRPKRILPINVIKGEENAEGAGIDQYKFPLVLTQLCRGMSLEIRPNTLSGLDNAIHNLSDLEALSEDDSYKDFLEPSIDLDEASILFEEIAQNIENIENTQKEQETPNLQGGEVLQNEENLQNDENLQVRENIQTRTQKPMKRNGTAKKPTNKLLIKAQAQVQYDITSSDTDMLSD